jgi:uncharacterized protein with von Willebrand factor type A (vWA) domain
VSPPVEAFDAEALERRYALLDRLPESLFHAATTHLHGSLLERVQGLLQWHDALLEGTLPDLQGLRWPERSVAEPLRNELAEMRLPHFCRGEKALTEALLLDVLEAAAIGTVRRAQWQQQLQAQLEKQERERRRKEATSQPPDSRGKGRSRSSRVAQGSASAQDGSPSSPEPSELEPLDARTLAELRAEASRLAELQAVDALRKQVRGVWEERVAVWAELEEVFGELGAILGRGWDLSRGILHSQGWLEMARLRKLLERLPALRQLIRVLGRMTVSENPAVPPVLDTILGPVRRVWEERRQVYSPHVRSETRGLERSADLPRMLPSEAALLGHPTLRLLWHARRAERTLLTYRVEGTDLERVLSGEEAQEAQQRQRPADGRGPILVCLDTSGSMEGTPEVVAKALVLEAMRVAHEEKRACYLYAFSGPRQVVEQELSLDPEGLTRMLAFLTQSFSGGTDVAAPLSRAVARLDADGWKRADLLLVSDGAFEVAPATRQLLERAREHKGLRSHGLLIGQAGDAAMAAVCSPVHRFTDWSAFLDQP